MDENHCTESRATVSEKGVTVERTYERRKEGIAGTLEIRSTRDEPVLVHVVDAFPAEVTVEDAAFKPGTEPDIGDISSERLSVQQTVDDEPVQIRYGLFPSDPVSEDQWDSPAIRNVAEGVLTRSTVSSSGAADEPTADGEDSKSSSPSQQPTVPEETDTGSLSQSSRTGTGPIDGSAGETVTAERDPTESEGEEETEGRSSEVLDAQTVVVENDEVLSPGESGNPDEVGGSDAGRSASAPNDEPSAPASGDEGSAPTSEDEPGTSAHEEEASDDRELDVPRSVEVRIDRLSARVEEFAAYATAIERLIDEHGSGAEVIDAIERELDDLDGRLDAVRDEVEAVQDTHAGDIDGVHAAVDHVDTRVEQAEDAVAALQSNVERHDSRLESVSSDVRSLDSQVEELDDDVREIRETVEAVQDDFSAMSDDVRSIRSELRDLRDEVSDLHSFRRTLAEISDIDD